VSPSASPTDQLTIRIIILDMTTITRDTITTDHIIMDHGITGTGTAIVVGIAGTTGIIGTDSTNVCDQGKLRLTLHKRWPRPAL
jgi:hypothetical protein